MLHPSIRTATPSDLPELLRLFEDTVRTVAARDYQPEQIAKWASSAQNPERWAAKMTEQVFWVTEETGEITGFISLATDGYIDFLYVHKDHQGKGLASRLLETVEAYAKRKGISQLYSDVSLTARPFFLRKGFVISSIYTKWLGEVAFENTMVSKLI